MSTEYIKTVSDTMILTSDLTSHLLREPNFPPLHSLTRATITSWIQALDTGLSAPAIDFLSLPVLHALRSCTTTTMQPAPPLRPQSPAPTKPVPTQHWPPDPSNPSIPPPFASHSSSSTTPPPSTPPPRPSIHATSSTSPSSSSSIFATPTPNRYCICTNLQHGSMIACDNHCNRKWFHYACVGLIDSPPAGTRWVCPTCRRILNIGLLTNGFVRGRVI